MGVNRYQRAMFPLLHISRSLGILPCNRQFQITGLSFIYSITLSIVIGVIPIYVQFLDLMRSPKINASAGVVLMTTSRCLRLFVVPSHLLGVYRRRIIFERLLRGIVVTDVGILSDLTYPRRYTAVGILYTGLAFGFLIARNPSWSSIIINVLGFCQFSSIYSLAMMFCTFLEVIKLKMACQNRSLVSRQCQLDRAIEVHQTLVEESHKCNKLFTVQLLTLQLFLSYQFVYSMYSVIVNTLHNDYKGATTFALSVILCLATMMLVCGACEDLYEEADKFNVELFKLMRENKDLCRNEKLQLYVTMKQTINFTACGFFTLGYPLVTSIIAAATTYLVILVQFSMPQKS